METIVMGLSLFNSACVAGSCNTWGKSVRD